MNNYRIKYKNGDFELEIESTEKEYIDKKFAEMLEAAPPEPSGTSKKKPKKKQAAEGGADSGGSSENNAGIDIPAILEAINDSDDHESIDKYILSKSAQLPRVIMCLRFAESELDSPYLTTGNIQTITDQLGIKMTSQNAAKVFKSNQKYFTADAVRKVGAKVKYKLNRKGLTAYDQILKGESLS